MKTESIEKFFEEHDWLMGQNNVKRAFAIWGYALLASLMAWGVLFVFAMVIAFIGGMASAF